MVLRLSISVYIQIFTVYIDQTQKNLFILDTETHQVKQQ